MKCKAFLHLHSDDRYVFIPCALDEGHQGVHWFTALGTVHRTEFCNACPCEQERRTNVSVNCFYALLDREKQ